jgi:hypothetical protein
MRVLDTFTPTQTQKQVIASIAGAATPTVAGDAISRGPNMVSARDTLLRLGFITFINGEATLTAQGQQLAVAENITDETGGLTAEGQALAQVQPNQATATEQMPPMESFAVLKSLLR